MGLKISLHCCPLVGLLLVATASATYGPSDERVQIYTKLFSKDPQTMLLSRDEILGLLERGRSLEEATPNGGSTTLEDSLIKLGDEIDSDRCMEPNLMLKIAWFKRRFYEVPSILKFLQEIEDNVNQVCHESLPGNYALTMVKLDPQMRVELRALSRKVGSMGVYLPDTRDIPNERLIEGVVSYIIDSTKSDHNQSDQIGDVCIPEAESQASQTSLATPTPFSSNTLSRDDSNHTTDLFLDNYKKLTKNCDIFLEAINPLMQYARASDKQQLELDSILIDLEKEKVVCSNLVARTELVGDMGQLFLVMLDKEQSRKRAKRPEAAPKSCKPIKKSVLGSIKIWKK